ESRRRAGDLGGFQGVGEARPIVVALVVDEYLGLVLELAERAAVDDPVPIALIGGAPEVFRFRVNPAARVRCLAGVRRQAPFLTVKVFFSSARAVRHHAASASERRLRPTTSGGAN